MPDGASAAHFPSRLTASLSTRCSLEAAEIIPSSACPDALRELPSQSFDLMFVCPPFDPEERNAPFKLGENDIRSHNYIARWSECISEGARLLKPTGSLLIYGLPRWLPFLGVEAGKSLAFKYWIAVEVWDERVPRNPLLPAQAGLLLYVKDEKRFTMNRVRELHRMCRACGDYLADWGGKKHMRNPAGAAVSDIWVLRRDVPPEARLVRNLPDAVLYRALELCSTPGHSVLLAPCDLVEEPSYG